MTRGEFKEFFRQAMWGPGEPLKNRLTKQEVFYKESFSDNGRCGFCEFYLNGGACKKIIGAIRREQICHLYSKRK